MRITYIHQHFRQPSEGGGGRPYEFARRLVSEGHNVTVIAGGATDAQYALDGINVVQVGAAYNNRMGLKARLWSFAKFMAKSSIAAARTPADLVFASSTPLTVAIPGVIGSVRNRSPFVFEVRDLWPTIPISLGMLPGYLHGPAKLLEKFAYSRASDVIGLSPGMVEGVLQVAPNATTHLIPNCSDFHLVTPRTRSELRDSFGIRADEVLMVYIGSLGYIYDAEWLSCLVILGDSLGIRVLIAGDGAHRDVISDRLRGEGIEPEGVLLGSVSRESAFELLGMSDVAISSVIDNPELMNASINKVFDALAAGIPIAFNHSGWLAELVICGGAGWRLPRQLTLDSLQSMVAELNAPGASSKFGKRAKTLAKNFDREVLFQQFHGVLQNARRSQVDRRGQEKASDNMKRAQG